MRVLIPLVALAACQDINTNDPVPVWTAADTIEGPMRPEVVQPSMPEASRDHLRIATYNTYHGIEVERLWPALLANPELAMVDVLLLQESDDLPAGGPSDAAQLAAALGMGYVYAPRYDLGDGVRGTRGLALLSRFAFRDAEVMFLQDAETFNFAPSSARAAMRVVIDAPSGPLVVVNVHLDDMLNITERILQLRPTVLDEPYTVVVAGDFNTNDYVWADPGVPVLPIDAAADTRQAPVLDAYMRDLGYHTPTANLGTTWHGFGPEDQRLDAIYTRGVIAGLGAVERSIDLSDHWPLWLDIKLRPAQL